MMDLNTFYLYLMLSFCIKTNQKNITWEAKAPIIFGGDAELNCNIPYCIHDSNCQASWHVKRGTKSVNIAVNKQSRDPTKYDILIGQNSYKLIIKNFGPLDVNKMYTCTYNFDSFSKMLALEEDSFELKPNNETMTVSDSRKGILYSVNVSLKKVYPKPKCKATYNGNDLTSDIISRSQRIGIFYWSDFTISVHEELEGRFLMTCQIGGSEFKINEVEFRNIYKDSCLTLPTAITVIITIGLTILFWELFSWMLRCLNITCDTLKGFGVMVSFLLIDKSPFPVDVLSNTLLKPKTDPVQKPAPHPSKRYSQRSDSTTPLLASYVD